MLRIYPPAPPAMPTTLDGVNYSLKPVTAYSSNILAKLPNIGELLIPKFVEIKPAKSYLAKRAVKSVTATLTIGIMTDI